LSRDPQLRAVIESIDTPFEWGDGDLYADLIESILSQQLSIKAAQTIHRRFVALFDDSYPHPAAVLALDPETIRATGVSRSKTEYIGNVARFFQEEDLLEKDWSSLTDQEIIDYLTTIKGVGRWTVEMLLMFTLRRPDILPTDDLGIQQAMIGLYGLQERGRPLHKKMTEIAESWRPYRTFACRYLWKWRRKG